MKKTILILTANPRKDLDLRREVHSLKSVIQDEFEVKIASGITSEAIQSLLLEYKPRIVHFCGHGAGEQGLVFENEDNSDQLVSNSALSDLFKNFANQVECVLLNACYSDVQATEISHHINYVIGMQQAIRDYSAIVFARGFYQALGYQKSIEEAYSLGCNAIKLQIDNINYYISSEITENERRIINRRLESQRLPEHLKPQLKVKSPLTQFNDENSSTSSEDIDYIILTKGINRQQYREAIENDFNLGNNNFNPHKSLTEQEQENRWREVLLGKVKEFWIKGVLEKSLFNQVLFEQNIINRPDAVNRPFSQLEEFAIESEQSFEFIQASDIFEGMGAGRTLLILGEPGTGKTISLLKLAERLIKKTEQDLTLQIPLVLNLSSWAIKKQNIADWLIEELKDKYQVSKDLAKQWIKDQQLILLLDGLDEVKKDNRNDCIRALNQFLDEYGITETVVCCRVQDYQELSERLNLRNAICIQPLSSEYISWYLDDIGRPLHGLKQLLQSDKELEEFARTPLIFSVMTVAYKGYSLEYLLQEIHVKEKPYEKLFDNYIEQMFKRRVDNQEFSQKSTKQWLKFIAQNMMKDSQSLFLIEKIQPNYLTLVRRGCNIKYLYHIGVLFCVYLLVSLFFIPRIIDIGFKVQFGFLDKLFFMPLILLLCGLLSSLVSILIYKWLNIRTVSISSVGRFRRYSLIIPFIKSSLSNGGISGLITASIYGIFVNFFTGDFWLTNTLFIYPIFFIFLGFAIEIINSEILEIKPVQTLEFSTIKMILSFFYATIFGLAFVLIYQIRNLIIWHNLDWVSLTKLFLPLVAILICFTIFNGFGIPTKIKYKTIRPNQGIWDSRNNMIRYIKIVAPIGAFIGFFWAKNTQFIKEYISLTYGILLALNGSILIFGECSGIACIKHFVLRVILYIFQHSPWNYARFLDYATNRLFTQKVGGGYIFIHRMLMEHFANMKLD